jgi:NAD(P)-dependent dehydrogenase (short-subunit alcohol dehydrogenase family)
MAAMDGKVVLITGGTDGIGKQAAKELAVMGARVVIAGRSEERCQETVEEVSALPGAVEPDYLLGDMSSMAEVTALGDAFLTKYDSLNVLMNNAGAGFAVRKETVDGFESTFALNHLAYFLLTNRLIEILLATKNSRIVSTSSGGHYRGKIHFDDLHLKKGYRVMKAYAQSKLANVMFTYALARRLEGKPITVNCFHPGLVKTGAFRKQPLGALVEWWVYRNAISVEEGTETMIYLASSAEVAGISGKYFYLKQSQETNPLSYIVEDQERLWGKSYTMIQSFASQSPQAKEIFSIVQS